MYYAKLSLTAYRRMRDRLGLQAEKRATVKIRGMGRNEKPGTVHFIVTGVGRDEKPRKFYLIVTR